MNMIINIIINMVPYMIGVIPFILVIRLIFHLVSKRKKINFAHEITLLVFIVFLFGLASQTIFPKSAISLNSFAHKVNLVPFRVLRVTYNLLFVHHNINYFLINFLGNIIMFIPIGFFVPLLWNVSNKKTLLIGVLSSLFIELSQLFIARATDIDDLMLNTLGVILGILLYNNFNKLFSKTSKKFKY